MKTYDEYLRTARILKTNFPEMQNGKLYMDLLRIENPDLYDEIVGGIYDVTDETSAMLISSTLTYIERIWD